MSRMHKDGLEVPEGLIVESIEVCDGLVTVVARSLLRSSACPGCGAVSGSVHSRYVRSLADLPSHGSAGRLLLQTRRFSKLSYIRRQFRDQLQDSDVNHQVGDFGICRRPLLLGEPTVARSDGGGWCSVSRPSAAISTVGSSAS